MQQIYVAYFSLHILQRGVNLSTGCVIVSPLLKTLGQEDFLEGKC